MFFSKDNLVEAYRAVREQAGSKKQVSADEARVVGDRIGVNWIVVSPEEFRRGMEAELEHGAGDPQTNVTNDDLTLTGKIALAHLKEFPDYYTRLGKMEAEARIHWHKGES